MDLLITITDENGEVFKEIEIYQDGSDSEGADKIVRFCLENFEGAAETS